MITGEKNRAHNCLTVSNLKLDDVFSDIFGKSARSITEQILQHPGERFDVEPFVDGRCKTPMEEIQAAVLAMIKVIKKSNPLGFPMLVPILNQFWCKLQML